jgi:hypothetical protein
MKTKQHFCDHEFVGARLFEAYKTALRLQSDAIWRSGISPRTAAEMKKRIGRMVGDMLFVRSALEDALVHERGVAALDDHIYFGRENETPPSFSADRDRGG